MRILITGANGFIGAHLAAALFGGGHEITACARKPDDARRQFPLYDWIGINFNKDTEPDVWHPRLEGVDAVVNCAGILQGAARQSLDAVHRDGPAALFEACAEAGVKRVIQISALGIDADAGTHYADSKRAADEFLRTLNIDWVILRPSLVYTAGVYGGTATLRGLAGFPFAVPLAGGGYQEFQPIHMDDLAYAVARLIRPDAPARISLDAVGPEPMTLREIVLGIRQWLGFKGTRVLNVPMPLVRFAAKIGDITGWFSDRGTLRTTAVRQLEHGNTADSTPFAEAIGFMPRRFRHGLTSTPSHVQDRWHARLAYLTPVLKWVLIIFLFDAGYYSWFQQHPMWPFDSADYSGLFDLVWTTRDTLVFSYFNFAGPGYAAPLIAGLLALGIKVRACLIVTTSVAILVAASNALLAFMTIGASYHLNASALSLVLAAYSATLIALTPRR